LECNSEGEWTGTQPECIKSLCDDTRTLDNGSIDVVSVNPFFEPYEEECKIIFFYELFYSISGVGD
jgi:hypothetical protein